MRPLERGGDVLDDAPVFARLAGTVHRLVHLDDAPFDLGHRALVFLVQAAGQDDVGVASGVVEEEVDGGVELELVEAARDERLSGSETFGLKQIDSSPLISPASIFLNIS